MLDASPIFKIVSYDYCNASISTAHMIPEKYAGS